MKKNKTMKEKSIYHVNNKQLYEEICNHRKAQGWRSKNDMDNPDAPMPDYVAKSIVNIANLVMRRNNFAGYTYNDDMIGDAIEIMYRYYNVFNVEKSNNPYGFFWIAAKRKGLRRLEIEEDQKAIKAKMMQNIAANGSFSNFKSELITEADGTADIDDFCSYLEDFYDYDLVEYEEKKKSKGKKVEKNEQ